jgi:uncharacterized protein (DUF1499 family)
MPVALTAPAPPTRRTVGGWLALLGLGLSVVAALVGLSSGLGYRLGLWHFRTGLLVLLPAAFWAALAAAALSLLGLLLSKGARNTLVTGVLGLALALGLTYVPWSWKRTLDRLPYIHDITTDTRNPPQFVAAAKLRQPGDHPVDYDGPEVAAQQQKAYPDLAPFDTPAPREQVYKAARAAIAVLGMKLTDDNPAEGRLEASHTSLFFGFTDDMVVRVASRPDGTRVDVRSKSRVGRSDLGQNAKRIRAFLEQVRAGLQS